MMKRAFDVLAASIGLVVLSPLMLCAAVAVRLSSRGPILFRQIRMGRDFREFEILKFRTMHADAPERGGQLTASGDPRVTRVGALLRKTKIDELPQLINVLRGEMSFVGPRPEVPKYVEMYREAYAELLKVRPGITDLASLKYRNESEVLGQYEDPEKAYVGEILPDKIELGRRYVRERNMLMDIAIILRTLLRLPAV